MNKRKIHIGEINLKVPGTSRNEAVHLGNEVGRLVGEGLSDSAPMKQIDTIELKLNSVIKDEGIVSAKEIANSILNNIK